MAHILIVDDDEDFASTIATVLNSAGHETSVELDIKGVVPALEKLMPDLLVLDVMFPEDSSAGFKMAREIRRRDSKFVNIPIVMLTAVNSEFPFGFNKNDFHDEWLPVTEFIEKPVDLDVLEKRVDELLLKESWKQSLGGSAGPEYTR